MPRENPWRWTLALMAVVLSSCTGRHAEVHVQLCVESESGATKLREILRNTAAQEGLRFVDMSKDRPAELAATGASLDFLEKPEDYFEVWGDGGAGAGFSAGNLGLSSFEISIGFGGGGREQAEAKQLADKVIAQLSQHWPLTVLPPDRGAFPTGNCPTQKQL